MVRFAKYVPFRVRYEINGKISETMNEAITYVTQNWIAVLCALVFAFVPGLRAISRYYSTLVHELGHGMLSLNPLGGMGGIKIKPDSSGENMVSYRGNFLTYFPIRVASLMSGYAAPIYSGLLMVVLAFHNQLQVFTWVILIISALSVFAIRNLFGGLVILLHAAFWVAVLILLPHVADPAPVVFSVGLVLLLKGFQDLFEVTKYVFVSKYSDLGTDFHILRDEFFLPRQFWYVLFLAIHTTILFFGIGLLLSL